MHSEQRKGTLELRHDSPHGQCQVAEFAICVAQHESGHLGVRVAVKHLTSCEKVVFEALEVFDDAVVNKGQFPAIAQVGVSVTVSGRAVGGPPRVGNPGRSLGQRRRTQVIAEDSELSGTLVGHQWALGGDNGHTGRVIAAVFETFQPAKEHLNGGALADISDNSTHEASLGDGCALAPAH